MMAVLLCLNKRGEKSKSSEHQKCKAASLFCPSALINWPFLVKGLFLSPNNWTETKIHL